MNSEYTYCEVCNVPLSGYKPAQQHYASEKHKAKTQLGESGQVQELLRSREMLSDDEIPEEGYKFFPELHKGFCYICDKELTSKIVVEQHIAGKSHQKAAVNWPQRRSAKATIQKPKIVDALSSGSLNELVSSSSVTRSLSVQRVRLPSTEDMPTTRKCYNFDVNISKGECFACDVKFESFKELQTHRRTDEHKENEQEWNLLRDETGASQPLLNRSDVFAERTKMLAKPSGSLVPDNTLWYDCEICNKRLNTAIQLEQHKQSPKHKKQEERSNAQISSAFADQTIWHSCGMCNKKLNSAEQLQIHMRGHGILEAQPAVNPASTLGNPVRPVSPLTTTTVKRQLDYDHEPIRGINNLHPKAATKVIEETSANQGWASGWGKKLVDQSEDKLSHEHNVDDLSEILAACNVSNGSEQNQSQTVNTSVAKEEIPAGAADWYTHRCRICEINFTGEKPFKQHLDSKRHEKKRQEKEMIPRTNSGLFATFRYCCEICKVPFNTEKDLLAHEEGKKHIEKVVKKTKAPERRLPNVKKVILSKHDGHNLTEFIPRSYQLELYRKAMATDAVCFLPTGTGKTLVAIMVLSKVLQENPYHSAAFLVDKNLLGTQQFKFINDQIGNRTFKRYDSETKRIVERTPRIALVCGEKHEIADGLPMWQQDIVVATAAFYENSLQNGIARWEDNCLVILDESHHCIKDHPYNRVMASYHQALPCEDRPKVLGLTASPAGRSSVAQTKEMLDKLLANLGGLHMVSVEDEVDELQKYSSTTKLVIRRVNLSEQEHQLTNVLQKYMLACYQRLVSETNIQKFEEVKYLDQYLQTGFPDNSESDLIADIAESILNVVDKAQAKNDNRCHIIEILKKHTHTIASCLMTIGSLGTDCAYKNMNILTDDSRRGSFKDAKQLGLECRAVEEMVENFKRLSQMHIEDVGFTDADSLPIVKELLSNILTDINWDVPAGQKRPIVLVLVRRRKDVLALETVLSNNPELIEKNIKTVSIVGHAAKTNEGLTVRQQDNRMIKIKKYEYQVIVATSIAEEGLDFPECELVVQMDPPNNVKSLVQIRGRARKKNSKFIALCRNQGQVDSLESLQEREGYMIEAVRQVVERQNRLVR